ncbi:efflux RND transporter periplasmic adaptor subunit [Anaeromyxobacter sp. PSR-1]|uniref:efflux RND transporter periplasmic adaptor subunit n=1 Tax=Anaeromyxobacter sp. PSR-1 TaxID=1300915 RepID=UPI0005E2D0A1|nr:efflux RND transporter periplasmic adaptor subunit [Anaeromyxobacter sp. PSR-1]GAO01479.1 multidrug resistance protein MdtA [Anaeromyxobacter sp. PSR-1]
MTGTAEQVASPPSGPAPAGPPAPGPRRARLGRAAVIAALVLGASALAGAVPRWRARAALATETGALAIPVVRVVSPTADKPGPSPFFPAEIKPRIEASLLARATGYVKRWTTDIGGHVKAGDVLAELVSPDLDEELARARQELAQSEASLTLATSTAHRYGGLVETSGVSEQENAEKQGELALKTAALGVARANVRRLEQLQRYTRITAPFAGTVTARRVDVGDLVTSGSGREVFRLAQTDTLRVQTRVPQTAAGGVVAGASAEVLIPELPGKPLPARVARTAGVISADSRTLLVELELPNESGAILAGSFARVRFLGAAGPTPLTLPANTLLFRPEGPRIGVVGTEDRVALRTVRLGRDFGRTVEILEGAAPKDRVILNPSDSLADGATVRVAPEAKREAAR